ncbi:MAG: trimeric intracellular cation channel family protein [Gemmatimonadota bacterium]
MYLYLFDLIGVAVFAISGALAAGRHRLDLIGVVVAAAATAVGGGTIRDVLLDRHPIFWLADARYLVVIMVAAVATILYVRWAPVPRAALDVADALGLALFSVTGAQVAERAGMPAIACVLLGAVTGAAGGVIRDVLLAQVPQVLQRGSLYATAAIAGASLYLASVQLGVARPVATLMGMACVALLRLAAIWWDLKLPTFEVQTGDHAVAARDEESR